jgi:hypothetical protein
LLFSAALAAPVAAQEIVGDQSVSEEAHKPNAIYGVDLSPNGKSYAILRDYDGQTVVAIYDADDAQKPPAAVGLGDLPAGPFAWGGEDHVLVRIMADQPGVRTVEGLKTVRMSRWMVVDKKSGKMETLFGNEFGDQLYYFIGAAGDLISTLPQKPGYALFARAEVEVRATQARRLETGEDDVVYSLQEANLDKARTRRVEAGKEKTIDWVVGQNGEPLARIDEAASGAIEVFAKLAGKSSFSKAGEIDYDKSPYSDVKFYGAAGENELQALVTEDTGAQKLVAYNLVSGAVGDAIFTPASGTVDSVIYDYRRGAATAVVADGSIHHLTAGDAETAASLEKAVPDSKVLILSKSVSGERMIVQAWKADGKTEYYFYDAPGRRLELIASDAE